MSGSTGEAVGEAANAKSVPLSELTPVSRSLEDVFMELTGEAEAAAEEGVSALLRSELIKLRTTRTFYALAGVAIGLAIVFVTLSALLSDPTEESVVSDVFLSDPTSLFILILAIVGITGEWRHRTITSSLLAAPLRVRFLAAKLLAFAAAGVLLSIASRS